MERYFKVTKEHRLYQAWFDYKKNQEQVNELYKKFKGENGIESHAYYVTDDEIYIVPTENDKKSFGNLLRMPIDDDLQKFKTRSKIGKAWVEALKQNNLKVVSKPMLIFYMKSIGGRYRSRLFNVNEELYCSLEPMERSKPPEGFIEIKASEFFKIIEDIKE